MGFSRHKLSPRQKQNPKEVATQMVLWGVNNMLTPTQHMPQQRGTVQPAPYHQPVVYNQ
jgi:hypothetical protein